MEKLQVQIDAEKAKIKETDKEELFKVSDLDCLFYTYRNMFKLTVLHGIPDKT